MNKQNIYATVLWTMFKLNRDVDNTYRWSFLFDDTWLTRQKSKIAQKQPPVLLLVADLFCETVYDLSFPQNEVHLFCNNLNSELKLKCIPESLAVQQYWSEAEYQSSFLAKSTRSYDLSEEIEKRKNLYNSLSLKIPKEELQRMANRAIRLFAVQEELVNKILYNQSL